MHFAKNVHYSSHFSGEDTTAFNVTSSIPGSSTISIAPDTEPSLDSVGRMVMKVVCAGVSIFVPASYCRFLLMVLVTAIVVVALS